MILGVRDRVAELVKQGKSPEEVVAAHPTSDFDSKVPTVVGSSDRFVGQLYAELKPAK
jgi:cyclase